MAWPPLRGACHFRPWPRGRRCPAERAAGGPRADDFREILRILYADTPVAGARVAAGVPARRPPPHLHHARIARNAASSPRCGERKSGAAGIVRARVVAPSPHFSHSTWFLPMYHLEEFTSPAGVSSSCGLNQNRQAVLNFARTSLRATNAGEISRTLRSFADEHCVLLSGLD